MLVGDKVKILVGKHKGKIGVIRSSTDDNFDVELPKVERYCFFMTSEIEPTSEIPDLRAKNVEDCARQALRVFCDFPPTSIHLEHAMRALERALYSK